STELRYRRLRLGQRRAEPTQDGARLVLAYNVPPGQLAPLNGDRLVSGEPRRRRRWRRPLLRSHAATLSAMTWSSVSTAGRGSRTTTGRRADARLRARSRS